MLDHILIRYLQSQIRTVSTSLSKVRKWWAHKSRQTTSESYTAVPSHNAGNTAVTAVNSLLLATFYAISERNQGRQQNQPVLTAEPNLHVQLHETATWRTKSVSNVGTRSQSELAESLELTGILAFYWRSFRGRLGVKIRNIRLDDVFI